MPEGDEEIRVPVKPRPREEAELLPSNFQSFCATICACRYFCIEEQTLFHIGAIGDLQQELYCILVSKSLSRLKPEKPPDEVRKGSKTTRHLSQDVRPLVGHVKERNSANDSRALQRVQ